MFGIGKKNDAIESFASGLVTGFSKRFPPALESDLGTDKLKPAAQLGKVVGELERQAVAFQHEQKLGVYGKAKLINSIKWQMKELGYSDKFVDVTATNLAQVLGKARAKREAK
jgi:hypothetical protein